MVTKHDVLEIPHRELVSARTGERFSRSGVLTDLLGFKDLFVHHEVIPPGRRSSSPHAHTHQEEMIFVLEGEVVADYQGSSTVLRVGDFMGFPPGCEHIHFVRNDSQHVARVLVIASRPAQDAVVSQL
jgi:uncharacterized cupin superfamily protein